MIIIESIALHNSSVWSLCALSRNIKSDGFSLWWRWLNDFTRKNIQTACSLAGLPCSQVLLAYVFNNKTILASCFCYCFWHSALDVIKSFLNLENLFSFWSGGLLKLLMADCIAPATSCIHWWRWSLWKSSLLQIPVFLLLLHVMSAFNHCFFQSIFPMGFEFFGLFSKDFYLLMVLFKKPLLSL